MKRWNWKSFGAGILCSGIIAGTCVPAVASVTGRMTQNQVNIMSDGTMISSVGQDYTLDSGAKVPASITFKDMNGGGTVYLPVRRVAEILNTEIGWDGESNSVVIGSSVTTNQPTPEPTPTPTPPQTIAYYNRYPGVPDFGAFAGISTSDIGDMIGSPGYYYDVIDVDNAIQKNDDLLLEYDALLVQCGFLYIGSFEGDSGPITCYSNGVYSIGVGITNSRFFCVLILE